MIKKILSFILMIVIIILSFIFIKDYVNVAKEKDPQFCLKEVVHEYEDGTVKECIGLGYKVYKYNRSSMPKGYHLGHFFIKMLEPKEEV